MIITNKSHSPAIPLTIFGYSVIIIAWSILFYHFHLGGLIAFIIFFLLGSVPVTTYGIQIDTDKRLFREYTDNHGWKRGKWISLDRMPYITVMLETLVKTSRSYSENIRTDKFAGYKAVFLSPDHRKKYYIKSFESKEDATKYAAFISEKTGCTIATYSPPVVKQRRR